MCEYTDTIFILLMKNSVPIQLPQLKHLPLE